MSDGVQKVIMKENMLKVDMRHDGWVCKQSTLNNYRSTIYTFTSTVILGILKASLVFEVRAVEDGVDIEDVP